METFLQTALSFPTLPFSLLMGVILLYWVFVIAGAIGIDALDGDGVLEGGVKGGVDALAAKGGALEGGAKAAAEVAGGHGDADAAHGHSLFDALGLGGVPVTVALSALVFSGWSLSLVGSHLLTPVLSGSLPVGFLEGGLFALACVVAVATSALAVRPLRPLFVVHHAPTRHSLMGRTCTIASGSVDASHGQATVDDGGAGLVIHVVCPKANPLKKGDMAVILDFDPVREVYEVEPADWLLPGELDGDSDSPRAAALARAKERIR